MTKAALLEVPVDNIRSAEIALKSGAGRLELCSALEVAGVTPSPGFVQEVIKLRTEINVKVPLFVMIRPRQGNFLYTDREVDQMVANIEYFHSLKIDGFVTGALTDTFEVDKVACVRLLNAAKGLPVTFHRAFDLSAPEGRAFFDIIEMGFARILTSGREENAAKGIETLKQLIIQAQGRIVIVPGGGINMSNIDLLHSSLEALEYHASTICHKGDYSTSQPKNGPLVKGAENLPLATASEICDLVTYLKSPCC